MGANTLKNTQGFSLIELMVVVVIVGILAAIVIPNYQNYVLRSHRTDAISALMDLASREGRYYTISNSYTSSLITLGYAADPMLIGAGRYSLSASAATSTFTLQAVPTTTGNQNNDTCGIYYYSDLGIKSNSTGTTSSCWKQ
jgi:type IV pilus assembly protein PilE